MNIAIPDFLLEMSEQINTQDNRITADPLWMVCYDKEYVIAEGYGGYYAWCDSENEYYEIYKSNSDEDENQEMINYLTDHYESWIDQYLSSIGEDEFPDESFDLDYCEMPDGIEKIWLSSKMEVVKACLTEADAKWFIQRKQHDYKKLYTYVFSMCYCPQMIELRNWIKTLSEGKQMITNVQKQG